MWWRETTATGFKILQINQIYKSFKNVLNVGLLGALRYIRFYEDQNCLVYKLSALELINNASNLNFKWGALPTSALTTQITDGGPHKQSIIMAQ